MTNKLRATTLVHKGGMEIGVHSIQTFARHFANTHTLSIHTDTSIAQEDIKVLLDAASGMEARIVSAEERAIKVNKETELYPKIKEFINRASYFAKLEIPMFEEMPYFYFDSDVIWLRHVDNLAPQEAPNAFSTESWSWYNGIVNDSLWIKEGTPRRVNSGVHYLSELFPFEKMEVMLSKNMFDGQRAGAGDQEIFAYLFNNMEYYHPEDIKRSRVLTTYDLKEDTCCALHFPGKMWVQHLADIKSLYNLPAKSSSEVRYLKSRPISFFELFRMRIQIVLGMSPFFAKPLNILRRLIRPQQ